MNVGHKVILHVILALGILVLLIGMFLNVCWVEHEPAWMLYLINLSPGLILLAAWIVGKNASKWRWSLIVFGVLLAVVVSAYAVLCNAGAYCWVEATTPDTDPGCYESVLQRYNYPEREWIGHFPVRVPRNATSVHFYHLQAFLQGGMILQLRCVLPSEEIESLVTESFDKAKQVQETHGDYLGFTGPKGLPIPKLCAGEKGCVNWPKGYKIAVFNAKDRAHGSWNHGFSCGVAVNAKRNEVIYWAENW